MEPSEVEENKEIVQEVSPVSRGEPSLKSVIEAILFSYGSPMGPSKIAGILGIPEDKIKELLKELKQDLASQSRGLRLLEVGNEYQLGTDPRTSPWIEKVFKEDFKEDLSPASLETLTIIAYRGPVSRADIDYIRGVNSSFILRSLLIRGLITRQLDPQRPQAWLYSPSFEFLKLLGLSSSQELPDFESLSKKLEPLLPPAREENESLNQL